MTQTFFQTLSLIRSDMQFRCDYEHKQLTPVRMIGFLFNPTIFSQVLFRFQGFFYTHHLPWIAHAIEAINSVLFTVGIDSSANIGPGFMLLHANYIQIGKHVTIGKQCILAQQNAIGPSYTMQDATLADTQSARGPIIGDHVLFGVGSAAFGSIRIGNYTKIGINTAVEKDFPDHAILIGVPAKNVNLG